MMMMLIAVSVCVCVAALVGGVALAMNGDDGSHAEDRLSTLTGKKKVKGGLIAAEDATLLTSPLDETKGFLEAALANHFDVSKIIKQADLSITVSQFFMACGGAFSVGCLLVYLTPFPRYLIPLGGFSALALPFMWLLFMRKRRIEKINKQLPEALELLGRSLRAGHSLAAGFGLIASEMPKPISGEFGRCFEEQNLGIPLEEALEEMTVRVPNMDIRFFATAVMLQRQTGGDLAEILDKIGRLVRERFKLKGQIQALTGEGRLSGIVLLALPPGLFGVMYFLNREYIMSLFADPMGHKMLAGAIIMQVMGALVIRKIINIKV
jgi:tight adherence protein B